LIEKAHHAAVAARDLQADRHPPQPQLGLLVGVELGARNLHLAQAGDAAELLQQLGRGIGLVGHALGHQFLHLLLTGVHALVQAAKLGALGAQPGELRLRQAQLLLSGGLRWRRRRQQPNRQAQVGH